MTNIDELQIYRGKDFAVNDYLVIQQRTLDDISDFGEKKYFSYVSTFCATPSDMMIELEQQGVDFVKIGDWEFFTEYGIFSTFNKEIGDFLFRGFDFSKLVPFKDQDGKVVLVGYPYYEGIDPSGDVVYLPASDYEDVDDCFELKICGLKCHDRDEQIIFTEADYEKATKYLRKAHKFKYNKIKPGNKAARKMELKLAMRDRAKALARKDKSELLELISAMTNVEGFKYGWLDVWDMKINAFFDAVSRVQKIKNAFLLLQSGYSGFGVDLNKFTASQKEKSLNWMGSLD